MEERRLSKPASLTVRSVLIAFLLIPLNSYWILYLSYVWDSNRPTSFALLFNVIFVLLALMLLNAVLRRWTPGRALRQTELLTIYAILCQGSVFAGRDMMQVLVPLMGNGFWYATLENEWAELFQRYLPSWLTVSNMGVLQGFYKGQSTLYRADHIRAWLSPVLIWMSFAAMLAFTMMCLNVILRRQWQEYEKLTYPIAQVPFEITKSEGKLGLFRNRVMWIGLGIAGFANLMNCLPQLIPSLPRLMLIKWIWFSQRPWSAMNDPGFIVSFFPFAIGLGFLIPMDLSFSCWFFYLLWQAERVVGSALGWTAFGFPNNTAQIRGAWVGVLVFTLWRGHRYFGKVLKSVFRSQSGMEGSGEAMRYRTAVLGALGGFLLIVLFCMYAGMSWWLAAAFFGIYLAMSVTITRVRAELGPPTHDMYNAGPDLMLTNLLGTRRIGTQNLSVMTMFFWLNHLSYRAHPMPHQLEALKLAHQANFSQRQLFPILVISAALGVLSASWGHLHISYRMGLEHGSSWYANSAFHRLASWAYQPRPHDSISISFSVGGFLFAIALLILRTRFLWWPLHPVGYLISSWWTFTGMWFPILISWCIKGLLLKYKGVRGYRQALPFFLGLIIGDVIVASILTIIGMFLGFGVRYLSW